MSLTIPEAKPSRARFGTTAAILLGLGLLVAPSSALAQEKPDESEMVRVPSMREKVFKSLSEAQTKADEGRYNDAIRVLDKLSQGELNSYEKAQTLNLYAYLYYSQDQYPKAVRAYEELLRQENLPKALEQGTVFTLSQLYFSTEQWRKSIEMTQRWFALTGEENPKAHEMLAQAHYQLGEHREAVRSLNRFMESARQNDIPITENHYLLLRILYYELGDYAKVAEVLEELIRRYPKEEYWLHLAAVYGELGNEKRQLGVMEIAYLQGFLDTESELVTLAGLRLRNGMPYQAGKLLEEGLEDGTISSKPQNWRLLSQAWTLAQEDEKAIPALRRVAELSRDGKPFLLLAQSYLNLDRFSEAAGAARSAISKGGLDRPSQAQMLLGQALFEMEEFGEAKKAFQAAQNDPGSRGLATQWLRYVENEIERRAELRAALE